MLSEQVLLIEDDPLVHEIALAALTESGRRVLGVMSVCEAEHLIDQGFRPDIAVIDVRLPDGNGIEICRKLKSKCPEVTCVIFSAHEAIALLAGEFGADAYVSKSATNFVSRLLEAIR
jgi:DNA-binding NarL/FixJ family response regulator